MPLVFSCNYNCEWRHPTTMTQKGWLSWVQDAQKWRFESCHQVTSKTSRDDIRGWGKFRIGSEGVLDSFVSVLWGQPLSCVWLFVAPILVPEPTYCYHWDTICPWDFPDKNTGAGSHSLLQGIFLTQELNLGLLRCSQILYRLSYQESPQKHIVRINLLF